jgi:hypothetical protein
VSAKPRQAAWISAPGIAPEVRSFLELVDPPDRPLELRAFVAGVYDALSALSPDHEVRFQGKPISALLEQIQTVLPGDARAMRTQWDQDALRGIGATAYRAFAQPAPPGAAHGYGCLKAILLGLLLVRHRDRATASLAAIDSLVRFIRLGSRDVRASDEIARGRLIASLPATFVPSAVQAALGLRKDVPESLRPRLSELSQAVDRLRQAYPLLDRGEIPAIPSSAVVRPDDYVDEPRSPQVGVMRSTRRSAVSGRRRLEAVRVGADGASAAIERASTEAGHGNR